MSYYKLKEDVFLVRGALKACIYDLVDGNLYNINKPFADFIDSFATAKIIPTLLAHPETDYFTILQHENLITETDTLEASKSILSLKKQYDVDFAWIEVTRQCNLSCTFCYEGSNPLCIERMSIDDFKWVVKNLVEAGIRKIQFIGGEPTILKDDLKSMIMHAREFFDFIEVYTNGVTINDSWCNFFKEYNIYIALSIHSYIPEEHDKITQVKGSHNRVLRGLRLVKKHNIPYRIGTVRNKSSKIGEPDANTDYHLQPQTPKATGMADIMQFDLDMFKNHAITKMNKQFPITKKDVTTALSGHQCFVKEVYISSLLDVFPCVMERRMKHGNLKDSTLVNMLSDKIRYLTKDNIEGCKSCEYRYGCFDCRPDSNGNDFYKKPWHCSYDPTTGEWHDLEKMFNHLKKRSSINSIPIVVESSRSY